MPTITSTAAGNWSAGGTWIGGVAPVDGDKAVINHTVTVDGIGIACGVGGAADSILIGAAGTLKWSRAANSLLTLRGYLKLNAAGAQFDMGKVGDEIPAAYTAGLVLNREGGGFDHYVQQNGNLNSFGFYVAGDPGRTRIARMTSAVTAGAGKTFSVDDATGWAIGDVIAVGHSNPANPAALQYERVTLTAIAPLTATFAYPHEIGCLMGNMASNVTIKAYASATPAGVQLAVKNLTAQTVEIRDAYFLNIGRFGNGQGGVRITDGATGTQVTSPFASYFGNIHYHDSAGYASPSSMGFAGVNRPLTVDSNIFYTDQALTGSQTFAMETAEYVSFDNCLVCTTSSMLYSPASSWVGGRFDNGMICTGGYVTVPNLQTPGVSYSNTILSGYGAAFGVTSLATMLAFNGCDFGYTHGWKSLYGDNFYRLGGVSSLRLAYHDTGSKFAAALAVPTDAVTLSYMGPSTKCEYTNKGDDVTAQEIYYAAGVVKRDNATTKRSTSAISIKPAKLATNVQHTTEAPVVNGATVRLVGYCQFDASFYNANDYNAPTVTISDAAGAVFATYTATGAANAAWEQFDISATNTTGADTNFTMTFTAKAKTVTTGTVYFDGVVASPFVTKARHYGFTIDEANPWRTVNTAVVANEATAAGYSTDFSFAGGASQSDTALIASSTFQKFYDYSQAWGCLNVPLALPVSSPARGVILAKGDIDTTGFSLTGSGSIAMDAFTLTSEMSVGGAAIAYTGGTYSQASIGSPAFSGGALTIDTHLTSASQFSMTEGEIVFGEASALWDFGSCTFSGEITLSTTAGQAVTVAINTPSGFTINNTEPGNITVVTPVVHNYVNATFSGNTTRVVLYNVTQGVEIDNSLVSSPATAYSFEITTEADDGDTIDLHYFTEGYAEGRTRFTWGAATQAVAVEQALDPVIQAFRTEDSIADYTTITEFNVYAPTIYIQADDADGVSKISRLATYYNGILTTEDGARYFRGGMSMLSTGAVRVNKSVVTLLLENVSATLSLRFSDEATRRLYTDDGTSIIAPSSVPGSIEYAYGGVPDTVETGVSGLTGPESAAITDTAAKVAAIQPKVDELYLLPGLDPAAPLEVDNDAGTRTAGAITQSVNTTGNVTTVQRL